MIYINYIKKIVVNYNKWIEVNLSIIFVAIGGAGRGHLKFFTIKRNKTSLPYFGVKLSCVCLMFVDRKKIAYSYLKVT